MVGPQDGGFGFDQSKNHGFAIWTMPHQNYDETREGYYKDDKKEKLLEILAIGLIPKFGSKYLVATQCRYPKKIMNPHLQVLRLHCEQPMDLDLTDNGSEIRI